ncbi:MAG: hypothetical protein PWK00_00365, partial [Coxiella burnetii]|nr:hypothetical protein [Coxiella burnetii]
IWELPKSNQRSLDHVKKWSDYCTPNLQQSTLEIGEEPSPPGGSGTISHYLPLFQPQKQRGLKLCEEKEPGLLM